MLTLNGLFLKKDNLNKKGRRKSCILLDSVCLLTTKIISLDEGYASMESYPKHAEACCF